MIPYEELQQFLKSLVSFERNNSEYYNVKCIITPFLITKTQTRGSVILQQSLGVCY